MTTIAWDGKTLAADKQMNTGSMPHQSAFSKIRRGAYHGMPALFAQCGTYVFSSAVMDWLCAGMPDDVKPDLPEDGDSFTVLVVTELGIYEYIDSLRPVPLGQIKWAMGSGSDFAFGAMDAGACAKRAVEIACARDVNSGMGIDTLSLRKGT